VCESILMPGDVLTRANAATGSSLSKPAARTGLTCEFRPQSTNDREAIRLGSTVNLRGKTHP